MEAQKTTEKIIQENAFEHRKKKPSANRLSANRPSNNWTQNIEEQALATYTRIIPLWLLEDEIDDFHEHLNKQNADIKFTEEIEEIIKYLF